jgi:hypothetical protein
MPADEASVAPARGRRETLLALLGWPFFISGCEAKPMHGTFEVVIFSYLDRPIFEVLIDRFEIGAAGEYPYSGGASMSGVSIKFGAHKVSWRTADKGETVHAANVPVLVPSPSGDRFLGVHIYPDNTVEFVTSQHFPELSERGREFDSDWRMKQAR